MTPSEDPDGAHGRASGGRLVSLDGHVLPLIGIEIDAKAAGGWAQARLTERFRNAYSEPLAVTYQLPLPADGVVGGYRIRIGERTIVGRIDRLADAREEFARALLEGRLGGLLTQERADLFTLELGSVPSNAEVTAQITVDQPLVWVGDGAWEWRWPTVVAPRYTGAVGRVTDAERIAVDVAADPLDSKAQLRLRLGDVLQPGSEPVSPSHQVVTTRDGQGGVMVGLAFESHRALDRDIVIRWTAAGSDSGVSIVAGRPPAGDPADGSAYALLTVTPPRPHTGEVAWSRDLVVLVDTSGSMQGAPLVAARRVVRALVENLGEHDRLQLIGFATECRHWREAPTPVTGVARASALEWLETLEAAGGTELGTGMRDAFAAVDGAALRQLVVVSDGLVGFEDEILRLMEDRADGLRVHCVGIGSAPNRSLTEAVARIGRGLEVLVGVDESPDLAVQRLLAHTSAPQLTGLQVSGAGVRGVVPARLPDVHAGAPVRIGVKLASMDGQLTVRARCADGALWERSLEVPSRHPGDGSGTVSRTFARMMVADLERRRVTTRGREAIDREIEEVGLTFHVATRSTAWVATSPDLAVDPAAARRERVPHALPYGMSIERLGLRQVSRRGSARPMLREETRRGFAPDLDEATRRQPTDTHYKSLRDRPPARFSGRIVQLTGDELMIELVAAGSTDWAPPRRVDLMLADGTQVTHLRIDRDRSTPAGRVAARGRLTLVVKLAGSLSARPRSLRLPRFAAEIPLAGEDGGAS